MQTYPFLLAPSQLGPEVPVGISHSLTHGVYSHFETFVCVVLSSQHTLPALSSWQILIHFEALVQMTPSCVTLKHWFKCHLLVGLHNPLGSETIHNSSNLVLLFTANIFTIMIHYFYYSLSPKYPGICFIFYFMADASGAWPVPKAACYMCLMFSS